MKFISILPALAFVAGASAQIINGGFETGNFSGWTSLGPSNAVVLAASVPHVGPDLSSGQWAAKLTSLDSGFIPSDFDTAFALPPLTLESRQPFTTGAGIVQTVFLSAGQTLRFSWLFEAGDFLPENDQALFIASGPGTIISTLSSVMELGDFGNSNWRSGEFAVSTTGNYRVGFAVFNYFDSLLDSTLYVDQIAIVAVPEPSTYGLVATGAVMILVIGRVRRNQMRGVSRKRG